MAPAPAQPPLAVTPLRMLGTAAWQLALALVLVGAGQVSVSVALPVTVKVALQVALLPAASLSVRVTVFVPRPTIVPATGLWVMTNGPLQSVATMPTVKSGTAAWQFAPALAL